MKEKLDRVLGFFKEVKVEMKRVTWPSRQDTLASTAVVLITVLVGAVFLGIVDFILSRLLKIFIS
jgi:preprotein translocase subunit SecE